MPRLRRLCCGIVWATIAFVSAHLYGQNSACRAVAPHELSPAEKAYSDGFYAQAEQLYAQALAQQPESAVLAARLIETLLVEDKLAQAAQQANAAASANPKSAAVLTATAEVQIRRGQPWLAMKSLDAAATSDPCYARVHLVRGRIFHIDSMYASERSELQKAYDIDVTDPDILMAWSRIMPAAHEIEGTAQALGNMKDLDAQTRTKAETSIHSMMPLLHEGTQTCKGLPAASSVVLPLLPTKDDGKHIDGFQIEVKFPNGAAKLQLDTAASGLYISKALADRNGFERALDAPVGTVQADTVQIGPLEFHDCMVGVSDIPFPGKADGFISTDILDSYLITIDGRNQKLKLDPLPPQSEVLPRGPEEIWRLRQLRAGVSSAAVPARAGHDRQQGPQALRARHRDADERHEFRDCAFGLRYQGEFHQSSADEVGSAGPGIPRQFRFSVCRLVDESQGGSILAFEPTAIDHNTGFDVAGLLGFDILGQLTVHLDYRDGLVKLESPESTRHRFKTKGL